MSYAIPFAASFNSNRSRHPAAPAAMPVPAKPANDESVLLSAARRLYKMRRVRDDLLADGLFSEPAWDIMLDLFISQYEGQQLSVSAVCIGARAPSATALRYLTMLQGAGLVIRTRDQSDGRRSHVQLTPVGRQRMVELLAIVTAR